MGAFEDYLKDVLLPTEAGFSDNPNDPGGATNHGVTQDTYDEYRDEVHLPHQDVKLITDAEVTAVYAGFWAKGACELAKWPGVALQYFDVCVNSGAAPATKLLQRALKMNGVDGKLGPQTLHITTLALSFNERAIAERYASERIKFYISLNNPAELDGWLIRAVRVSAYALGKIAP